MATFVDSMLATRVPDVDSALVSSRGCFRKSDVVVMRFLVDAIMEVLRDRKTLDDIDKRIREGSGIQKRLESSSEHGVHCGQGNCGHSKSGSDDLSRLIQDSLKDSAVLERLAIGAIERSALTFAGVLRRGQDSGASPLDASTAGFLRRKIFVESVTREVVQYVKKEYETRAKKSASDGTMFALPSAIPNLPNDLISNDQFSTLVSTGCVVVKRFFAGNLLPEFERMDALGRFEKFDGNEFFWTNQQEFPSSDLFDKLRLIPFVLNRFNPKLFLQQVGHFQVAKRLENFAIDRKFVCVAVCKYFAHFPKAVPGDLVIIEMSRFSAGISAQFCICVYLAAP